MSRRKYGNTKSAMDGIKFDSKKEMLQYLELKLRKKAGDILDFKMQVPLELQPSFKHEGKTIRAIKYVADFIVYHDGYTEVIETKGYWAEHSKIKWKMLLYKYGDEYTFTVV